MSDSLTAPADDAPEATVMDPANAPVVITRFLCQFFQELLGPPAWARQAEAAIAAIARRRQESVDELESWLASRPRPEGHRESK